MAIIVKKERGEKKEDVIARFRRIFTDEGILDEMRERKQFVKASRKRYEKKKAQRQKRKDGKQNY